MSFGLQQPAVLHIPQLADGTVRRTGNGVRCACDGADAGFEGPGEKTVEVGVGEGILLSGDAHVHLISTDEPLDLPILEPGRTYPCEAMHATGKQVVGEEVLVE